MRIPFPARRHWGLITVLLVGVILAVPFAVEVDRVRVARSVRSTPAGTGPTAHELMSSLITRGEMPGSEVSPELRARFGWKLQLGEEAPDFVLPRIEQSGEVTLSSLRGKPVVLTFGSMTCDLFCSTIDEVQRLQRVYGDKATFLFINVTEAGHSIEGMEFLLEGRAPDPPTVKGREGRPRTPLEKRRPLLQRGMKQLKMTLPGVVDIDGRAEVAYDAFPRRLVVVDAQGRIAVDLGKGVLGEWDLAKVETWLKEKSGG